MNALTNPSMPPPSVSEGASKPDTGRGTSLPYAVLELSANMTRNRRNQLALADILEAFRLLPLAMTLAWLDIKLRYRGSLLGPFWLTLSTAVMVGALGFLNSALYRIPPEQYLPFLSTSLVLWGFLSATLTDACTCFTVAEGVVRAVRLPFFLQALRCVLRNLIVLAHNITVPAGVFIIAGVWPGWTLLLAVPAVFLCMAVASLACLSLGAVCARFRDVPPIIGSILQIAFFLSAIIWQPDQISAAKQWLLWFNPFYDLTAIMRDPVLGTLPNYGTLAGALVWSAAIGGGSWLLFQRIRGRIAFWV
jgi:lipopolysaccharide transport system permease protein